MKTARTTEEKEKFRSTVLAFKTRINELAAEQKDAKLARKTVYLPKEREKELRAKWPTALKAAWSVEDLKPLITALLNVYHEFRGSAYRHGTAVLTDIENRWRKELLG